MDEFHSLPSDDEAASSPNLTHLFTMQAELGARLDGGEGPLGRRVFNSASGGRFAGARMHGLIAAGAADWMLIRRDGSMVIDARVVLQTHDGATIHMSYAGRALFPEDILADIRDPARRHRVDPSRYYMRTTPTFETGAESYAWLNDIVCVATGRLTGPGLTYEVFKVD